MAKTFGPLDFFGSLKLTVVLVMLLMLLTYIGTLAQVQHGLFDAQRLYFDSWYVLHPVRGLRVPLPGGQLVMVVLFANLMVGGFLRMRRTRRVIGVYIAHVGIAVLLLAGFVKLYYSDDGYVALFEKDSANYYESHYHWELAIAGPGGTEYRVPERVLQQAVDQRVQVRHAALPFELRLEGYAPNAMPRPAAENRVGGDVVDGFFLERRLRAKEREGDNPGIYLAVRARDGAERRMILWGSDMLRPRAWQTRIEGEEWSFDLRRERGALPFTVRLDDFRKEDHPGTRMAAAYESDITRIGGGEERPVLIEMNAPLRDAGFVLFQSSWGPSDAEPGQPLYSQFSVVKNPSDHWPLWACVILAIGLAWHFLDRLSRFLSSRSAQGASNP